MTWFLVAFTSALFSAAAAISQKKVLFKISALNFSLLLSFFNFLIVIPLLFTINFQDISPVAILILYGKSILGSLAFLCVMMAIKNMEISGALPLMALTPGIVALLAFSLLGEALSNLEIIGVFLLVSGTYILESGHQKDLMAPFKVFYQSRFHHFILGALLLFSVTSVLDKYLLREFRLPPDGFLFFQQMFFLFNFSIMFAFSKNKLQTLIREGKEQIFWIIIIAALTIGYRYTQIIAINMAPVALVLAVKRISVFFAAIVGGKIFAERDLFRKAVATAIIITGAILIVENV